MDPSGLIVAIGWFLRNPSLPALNTIKSSSESRFSSTASFSSSLALGLSNTKFTSNGFPVLRLGRELSVTPLAGRFSLSYRLSFW